VCNANLCLPIECVDRMLGGEETDIDCGGGRCPPCENGLDCLVATDCVSLFCDPEGAGGAGGASGGSCAACGDDVDCEGVTDHWCDGGLCEPQKAVGLGCVGSNECLLGNCVDSFCCDDVCDDVCEGCAGALTGQGDGSCAPIPDGDDPDVECDASDAACRQDVCGGVAGQCKPAAANVVCRPAAGECDVDDTCDGSTFACPNEFHPVTQPCDGALGQPDCDPDRCDGNGSCDQSASTDGDGCDDSGGDPCCGQACVAGAAGGPPCP
jgi:hypothetical protein